MALSSQTSVPRIFPSLYEQKQKFSHKSKNSIRLNADYKILLKIRILHATKISFKVKDKINWRQNPRAFTGHTLALWESERKFFGVRKIIPGESLDLHNGTNSARRGKCGQHVAKLLVGT